MKFSNLIHLKKASLLLFFLMIFQLGNAQETPSTFWAHVHYGGALGVSFGNEFFSGTIAPSAIYEFNEQFALGLGANFSYNSQKNFYETIIAGGSVLALFNVIPQLQLSSEFELLNVSRTYDSYLQYESDYYWYPALYLGAGYRSGNFSFGIRFDVLYNDEESVYANPWMPFFRVYI